MYTRNRSHTGVPPRVYMCTILQSVLVRINLPKPPSWGLQIKVLLRFSEFLSLHENSPLSGPLFGPVFPYNFMSKNIKRVYKETGSRGSKKDF